jgi:two-component sensor histidine kinase
MKQHDRALVYAKKATEISEQLNSPTRLANAYGQLYVVYNDMGQYDSALRYYIISDHIGDSFANLNKTQQIAEMQTRFETEKKESEIDRLSTVNLIKNRQIRYLVGGLILFGLLAGAMVWLYRRVNHQRNLITRQSKQMEVMMKELHHRVKNNLQIVSSLLSLQSYRLKDEESIAAIRESQQRVQAMSFIHQRLYKTDELTTVNVREYITDLSESLLASYGYARDQFDLQIVVENELLDVDKALPIGLIVNEIVTNAFKYAYKNVAHPSLHISCTEQGNDINLTIKDNGAGLDETKWKQTGGSFGKQLVTTLCRQLRAKQSLDVNNGTRFQFVIPKNMQAA